jgi:hypothetical protein
MAAKSSKKAPAKAPAKKSKPRLKVTRDAVTYTLSAEEQAQMKACLKRSGRITIKFKEITVTKLPSSLESSVVDPVVD